MSALPLSRPSPKAKAVTLSRRFKASSSARSSRSTRSSCSDVMTQTEESTPSPTDTLPSPSTSFQTGGDDTPRNRTRPGVLSESWDLASLDPATWPVLKDAIGASTLGFTMDRMSMASVPEGEASLMSQQSLEDAVTKAAEEKEELHELCWDVLRLASSVEKVREAPLSHRELVNETKRCVQLLRRALRPEPKVTVHAPERCAGSPLTPAPRSPILKQFRLVSDPSIVSSLAAPALPAQPAPYTVTLHSPQQVPRFVSDGRVSPPRAFSPLRPASAWSPVGSPLGRSRSVSVTRRHYRQCWVLEREERFVLPSQA